MGAMTQQVSTPTRVADDAGAPLLEMRDVHVTFPVGAGLLRRGQELRAVDGVDIAIAPGETLGLVGESGSGKSTLGLASLRLVPSSGTIRFEGEEITAASRDRMRRLRRRMQIVFQDPYGSLDPRMRIDQAVAEPLDVHGELAPADRPARVRELLGLVGLRPDQARRYPHQLSGGQRQRVAIARALAVEPRYLVCDEPISALDVSIPAQVLNLLVDLRQRLGLTYLFIGHDLAVMRYVSDRIAVMYLGRIVEVGDPDALFAGAAHPYTRALVSALPIADPATERRRQRVILRGDIPSPITPPPGCRFHTRCWLYEQLGGPERCRTEQPRLEAAGAGHLSACHFQEALATSPVGRVDTGLEVARRYPSIATPTPTAPVVAAVPPTGHTAS
jgi:oligopeptide/dipeptide ABC transporter ATP-binding protein